VERGRDRQIKRERNKQDRSARRAYKRCKVNRWSFFFACNILNIYVSFIFDFSRVYMYVCNFPDFPPAALELFVLNLSLNSKQWTAFFSRLLPPQNPLIFIHEFPLHSHSVKVFPCSFPNLFIYFSFGDRECVCVFVVFMALFRFRVSAMKVQTSKMQLFLSHIDTQPIRISVSVRRDTGNRNCS